MIHVIRRSMRASHRSLRPPGATRHNRTPLSMMGESLALCACALLAAVGATRSSSAATDGPGAQRQHAIAMHGAPEEAAGFRHFRYTNPDAPKGGRAVLGISGSFDSLNPLIIKGVAAAGVREFVVESLLTRGLNEPFTLYGLLAEAIEVPEDRSAITFHLDARARFSDGKPVTADDVLFSWEILRDRGRPNYRTYYRKVQDATRIDARTVRFTFKPESDADTIATGAPRFDREMPLIMGLMPVLPRHQFDPETFEQTSLEPFVASGPYVFGRIDRGRAITYVRDPDYWGKDLAVNRGRFNFDEIRFDYYRDASVMLESFRTGDIDVRPEEDPARWAEGYKSAAYAEGRIVKREFDIALPAGMTALAFNTRRPFFHDPRVRQALILLFDFEFINRSLYFGLFQRSESYFARSMLAANGRPADARERQLLAPFKDAVKPDVLEGRYRFPTSDGSGQNRDNWRRAFELLKAAGYEQKGGKLVHAATGQNLSFEILANTTAHPRLLASFTNDLARLGISANVRVVDSAQYQSRLNVYDFDMIQTTWPSSLSPGNEQLFRWSRKAAATDGTFNFAGVDSAAADAMISAMLSAKSAEDFVSAVRALDRVLISGDYVIPLFHVPKQWVAHWRHIKSPAVTPISGYSFDTWWIEGQR